MSNPLRKELENTTFELWKQAKGEEREVLEGELRALLMNHAQAVMYAILRRHDPTLQVEAVDRVIMALPSFEGNSAFTTWAHKVLMDRMYDQRREDRKYRGNMDIAGFDMPGQPSLEMTNVLLTVEKVLDEDEYKLFQELVLIGKTQEEVARERDVDQSTISRSWTYIQGKLRDAFTKRLQAWG